MGHRSQCVTVATTPSLACCGVKRTTTLIGSPDRRFIVPWLGDTCPVGGRGGGEGRGQGVRHEMWAATGEAGNELGCPACLTAGKRSPPARL
jgi:hypothetical protein